MMIERTRSPSGRASATVVEPKSLVRWRRGALLAVIALAGAAAGSGCKKEKRRILGPLSDPPAAVKSAAVTGPGPASSTSIVASPEACEACEKKSVCAPFMDCSSVKGNAPDGRSRADLCKETLECLRKTNCAKVQVIDCYCDREKSPDECRAGKAKGACAAALEAGLETTDPATVLQRLGDVNYGGGLATRRVDCNTFYCAAQCFQ